MRFYYGVVVYRMLSSAVNEVCSFRSFVFIEIMIALDILDSIKTILTLRGIHIFIRSFGCNIILLLVHDVLVTV